MTVVATSRGRLGSIDGIYYSINDPLPGVPDSIELGWPVGLGVWYAENPLLTLVGLLSVGAGIGWFARGMKNRSSGMSGFAGTPEQHRTEWKKMMRAAESEGSKYDLIRAEQESIWFTLTPQEKKRHVAAQRAIYQGDYTEWEK